jgi:O-antigen/teichoic acid export membrane protein
LPELRFNGAIFDEWMMQKPSEAATHQIGKRTTLGTGLLIASKVMSRCIDLISLTVLARLLTPADFGLVAIAMSVLTIAEAVLELPVALALLALPERTKAHFDTAFTLQLARGALLALILVAAAWPLAAFYHDSRLIPLLCVLSLAPVASGLVSPLMTEYAIKLDFRPVFAMEITSKLIAMIVSVGTAYWSTSYWSLAFGTIASPLAGLVISFIFAPYFPAFALSQWSVFSGYLRWTTLTQLLTATNWQMDQLLLGRWVDRFQLGAFSMAANLSGMPGQILIGQTFRPLLVGFSLVRDDRGRLTQAYLKSVSSIVTVGLPLLVGMGVTADPLIRVILGDQWSRAAPLLTMLCLTSIPALFIGPIGPLGITLNRPSIFFRLALIEFVFKLPLMLLALMYYNIPGVLAVRLATALVVAGCSMFAVRKLIELGVVAQLFSSWRPMMSAVAMVLALRLVGASASTGYDHFQLTLWLVLICTLGAIVYVGVLLSLWFLNGRPDSIETKVVEFFSQRLGRVLKIAR